MASMKRSIARNMAKTNMKDFGLVHIFKKNAVDKGANGNGSDKKRSPFSLRWRKWVNGNPFRKKAKKK